ncbi:ABC transporter ATP-binding protein [Flavobacteriales bacterium]|nr:ABC transporter ATP-binding protein [Flavobacteriales bacterium]
MMENVLSINKITKRYPKLYAVKDLSMKVDKGNVFGILGPNGSGKTTTLGVILGVINATSGTYSWFGQPDNINNRKKIGALLETPNFYDGLSGKNNLRIVAKIKNVPEEDIQRVAKIVELDERMSDKFKTYSLGMKQRLAIASTLLGNPEVIILDEPTNGLDPKGIIDIRELISKISSQGVTVLLASHVLDEVEKICTHVCILKKGAEVIQGKIDDLVKGENFVEVSSEDLENLKKVISEFNGAEEVSQEKDKLIIRISPDIKTTELNHHLVKNNINISHFASRKKSLEKFYLESTE